jgi:hypothetical protein
MPPEFLRKQRNSGKNIIIAEDCTIAVEIRRVIL